MINPEGEEERINHLVDKKWEISGNVHASMENKLKFLYENGRKKQGMYLRNQNISDELLDEQSQKRAECKKIHGHIKCTVKFDISRVRNESRKLLYPLLSFIVYQLLVLAEIQNKFRNKNSFGIYF